MTLPDFQKPLAEMNRAFYGADVEIEDHPTREVQRGRQRLPLQMCRWKAAGARHCVLLEPVLKAETVDWGFPIGKRQRFVVDNEAMRGQLRKLVQSTIPKDHP